MAPTKAQSTLAASKGVTKPIVSLSRRATSARTQQQKVLVDGLQNVPVGKRKADASPGRNEKGVKRSALGNVTNAVLNAIEDSKKLTRSKTDAKKSTTTLPTNKLNENQAIFAAPNVVQRTKVTTRAALRAIETTKSIVNEATAGLKKVNLSNTIKGTKKKTETITTANNNKIKVECPITKTESDSTVDLKANARRLSNEFDLLDSEDSHYMSALEDL